MSAIYWIAAPAVGMVKVGYTRNLTNRLRDLRATSPCPLNLLVWLNVEAVTLRREGTAIECRIHQRYLSHHSHGEWFHDCALIQSDITAVKTGTFVAASLPEPLSTAALLKTLHPNRRVASAGA